MPFHRRWLTGLGWLISLAIMTPLEHEFFGRFYLGLVAVFFLVVLPIGIFFRKKRQGDLAREQALVEEGELPPPLPRSEDPYEAPSGSRVSSFPVGWEASQRVVGPLDLLVMGFYALLFYGFWAGAMVGAEDGESSLNAGVLVANMVVFLILGGLVPMVLYWRTDLVAFFGLKWEQWPRVFAIAPLFVIGLLVIAALVMGLTGYQQWVEANFGGKAQEVVEVLREASDPVLLILLVISAVVVAPLAEELIFRGYIYPVAKEYTGMWMGALFSGVLFGVIHFNLMGLPILALFGVALALIYEKTKSIWVPIACHAAFNGFQVSMVFLLKYLPIELPS